MSEPLRVTIPIHDHLDLVSDGSLIDHRPDLPNSAFLKFIKYILAELHVLAVNRQVKQGPDRRAVEPQPAGDYRRLTNEGFDVKKQIWNRSEIVNEHGTITDQPDRLSVVVDVLSNKLMKIVPVLPVQAGDVATIEVGTFSAIHSSALSVA